MFSNVERGDPPKGSAILAGAILRDTILAGGKACRPLIARAGLSQVLVEPAIALLLQKNANICFEHELHGLTFEKDRVEELKFGNAEAIMLGGDDVVVLAVPPWSAKTLLPNVTTPTEFNAIVSAHFKFVSQGSSVPLIGIIGGIADWLFTFDDRLSVTISNAERFLDLPRDLLAQKIWSEVCKTLKIEAALPPWQIVRERRATFAATPTQNALRPSTRTDLKNLFLAGDWTNTQLPATIEGAIQSGYRAADVALRRV